MVVNVIGFGIDGFFVYIFVWLDVNYDMLGMGVNLIYMLFVMEMIYFVMYDMCQVYDMFLVQVNIYIVNLL